jgi:hypothetical protein
LPVENVKVGLQPIVLARLAEELDMTRQELEPQLVGRQVDKFSLTTATYELGKPFPGLEKENLIIVAMFDGFAETSAPGDIRFYVAPVEAVSDLQAAATGRFLCYTINRGNLSSKRESLGPIPFVDALVEEYADRISPEEEEEEGPDDDDEEEVGCEVPECEAEIAFACTCTMCQASDEGPVLACKVHRPQVDQIHLRRHRRPTKWEATTVQEVPHG